MLEKKNLQIVNGYFKEILINRNLKAIDKYFALDLSFNGKVMTNQQFVKFLKNFYLKPFPDFYLSIEDQIVVEDKVVTRVYLQGTHKGEFEGIPPTNKEVKVLGITIDCIVDGKVKEMWHEADIWGLLKELGVRISLTDEIKKSDRE
ncbi:MAG: ester cyclase [Candidatus Hodarchaeota archaeon]